MAALYALKISQGKKHFSDVLATYKDETKQILKEKYGIDLDLDENSKYL